MGKETNKKILNAADRGVPNAVKKAKDKKLGPALPNINLKKATGVNDNKRSSWA